MQRNQWGKGGGVKCRAGAWPVSDVAVLALAECGILPQGQDRIRKRGKRIQGEICGQVNIELHSNPFRG